MTLYICDACRGRFVIGIDGGICGCCKTVPYCSRQCQKFGWENLLHKQKCRYLKTGNIFVMFEMNESIKYHILGFLDCASVAVLGQTCAEWHYTCDQFLKHVREIKFNFISVLPPEILYLIFDWLNIFDKINVLKTCSYWKAICTSLAKKPDIAAAAHIAASCGNVKFIRIYCSQVKCRYYYPRKCRHESPFYECCRCPFRRMLNSYDYLRLKKHCWSLIRIAIRNGHIEIVRYLFYKRLRRKYDKDLLVLAASCGQMEIILMMIKKAPSIFQCMWEQMSCIAADKNNKILLKYCVEHSKKPCRLWHRLLKYSAETGNLDMVKQCKKMLNKIYQPHKIGRMTPEMWRRPLRHAVKAQNNSIIVYCKKQERS